MTAARATKMDHAAACLFLAAAGAAYWAVVRYGGQGCGWTSGLMWGLAWRYLSVAQGAGGRRPYGSPWLVLAMVAGMYLGGMHGYGQFHSWVEGEFHLDSDADRAIPIAPFWGYWWNFLCGLGWGGVAAVLLAWAARDANTRWWDWPLRIAAAAGGAWAFRALTVARPEWIMPLFDQVDYFDASACPSCSRTVDTLVESMMWLGFLAGGLTAELVRRRWRNAALIGTLSIGFGAAFILFQWFHTLPNAATSQIGWWKWWETSVGFLGGATLWFCFWAYNRPAEGAPVHIDSRPSLLLGLWTPLLVSAYVVFAYHVPRITNAFGAEAFCQGAVTAAPWVLGAIGVAGAAHLWRRPDAWRSPAAAAWLFAVPYVVLFAVAYVPQLGKPKVWTNWALPIQLAAYAALFIIGGAGAAWIAYRGRVRRG